MASVVLTIDTAKDPLQYSKSGAPRSNITNLMALMKGFVSGALLGSIGIQTSATSPVSATATITITHANVTNADTTTILGEVITAATSGNGTTSWTIGANATADAVAMAACINANTNLSKYLVATSALGVVNITVSAKGALGNLLASMSTSDATAFAFVQWAGGTGGAESAAMFIGR